MNIARGDLAARIARNVNRLKADEYRYPAIFSVVDDWPGDWVGRTLLALCEQYEATNRTDNELFSRLNKIVRHLGEYVNEDCYCGERLNGDTVNEQQLSGNNWYIRALCSYYRITEDSAVLHMLQTIAKTLLPAIAPFYGRYPRERKQSEGGVSGHIVNGATDGWRLSSDVGCAFILLDGVTDLYAILHDDAILDLAKNIADLFLTFDYSACRFQTHAMLSATRGVVRIARFTGDNKYLSAAEKNFALYESTASTVNYANFNWFRRPDSWTEPCGFIDSLILAFELYSLTGSESYLRFCNRVYFNAVRTAQRKNGGAGCETCLSAGNSVLKPYLYEAYFCCTLRLANGLNYIRSRLFSEKDGAIFVRFALDGEYRTANTHLVYQIDADFSRITVKIVKGKNVSLFAYMPEGAEVQSDGKHVAGKEDCFAKITSLSEGVYSFGLSVAPTEVTRSGSRAFFFGDRLLTQKQSYASAKEFLLGGKTLSPIADCVSVEEVADIESFVQNI